jgi:hypothetical protein
MKQIKIPNLGILQYSVLHVLSLTSTFLKGGKMTQEGINSYLLFNIILLITSRWLYTRSIAIDGNFSAEHLKMKQPEGDVALSPGGRYMVEPKRYELHLRTGMEIKQVSMQKR